MLGIQIKLNNRVVAVLSCHEAGATNWETGEKLYHPHFGPGKDQPIAHNPDHGPLMLAAKLLQAAQHREAKLK